jgi:hypothetical protein
MRNVTAVTTTTTVTANTTDQRHCFERTFSARNQSLGGGLR